MPQGIYRLACNLHLATTLNSRPIDIFIIHRPLVAFVFRPFLSPRRLTEDLD